jgi:uncharacterized membrane protein
METIFSFILTVGVVFLFCYCVEVFWCIDTQKKVTSFKTYSKEFVRDFKKSLTVLGLSLTVFLTVTTMFLCYHFGFHVPATVAVILGITGIIFVIVYLFTEYGHKKIFSDNDDRDN